MITITDRAVAKAKSFREKMGAPDDWVMSVGLQGGGCSGFKYLIDFIEPPEDESIYKSIESDGLRVLVDKKSYLFPSHDLMYSRSRFIKTPQTHHSHRNSLPKVS